MLAKVQFAREEGFEPTSLGSKARVLPLDDSRMRDNLRSVLAEEEGFEPS